LFILASEKFEKQKNTNVFKMKTLAFIIKKTSNVFQFLDIFGLINSLTTRNIFEKKKFVDEKMYFSVTSTPEKTLKFISGFKTQII
jgi:hypothetical protein